MSADKNITSPIGGSQNVSTWLNCWNTYEISVYQKLSLDNMVVVKTSVDKTSLEKTKCYVDKMLVDKKFLD
jgi:hypothetical protein